MPGAGASLAFFRARLVKPAGDLATLLQETLYSGDDWQTAHVVLDPDQLATLNAERAAGSRVYLLFELSAQFLYVNLDQVAFRVSGETDRPALQGSIAYVGLDENGYAQTVNCVDPNGGRPEILWTHPGSFPATNTIGDVAWRPDALELAFTSNHEAAHSAFHSDVFGLRPDGSSLRRITNPSFRAELEAGSFRTGAVTGSVYNNYGRVTSFHVYVEGAQEAVAVDIGDWGERTEFTVENVADLGLGLHYVVFCWSAPNCANGREYAAAVVDVDPGETADAGVLTFNGNCGEYYCQGITWRHDGSHLGVHVISPKRFLATGEAIGADLFDAPLTACGLAWSPVDDRILYRNQSFDPMTAGICLTSAGGDAGIRLVPEEGAVWVSMAWLPDGSGFVYALDSKLSYYDLTTSQTVLVAEFHNEFITNLSLSPDGNHIVFERQTTGTPVRYDLWLADLGNPEKMWPLTSDGRSTSPDWSRAPLVQQSGNQGGNP